MYAFVVDLDCGKRIGVLHAYSPPWPLERLNDVEVWMTQLLADAVGRLESIDDIPWIVAGDLNLSETFDLRMVDGGTRGLVSCWLPLQSSIASLLRNILGLERRTFPTRPTDHVCNLQRVPPTNMNVFDLH